MQTPNSAASAVAVGSRKVWKSSAMSNNILVIVVLYYIIFDYYYCEMRDRGAHTTCSAQSIEMY